MEGMCSPTKEGYGVGTRERAPDENTFATAEAKGYIRYPALAA